MKIAELLEYTDHSQTLNDTGFWGHRAAGCIFIAKDTKRVLLAFRSEEVLEPHTWGTWGGAVDEGESFEQAMKREVHEETEFTGRFTLIPLLLFKHSSGFRYQNYAAVVEKEFTPILGWEHDAFKWVEYGNWPTPLHPGLRSLLKDPESIKAIKQVIA